MDGEGHCMCHRGNKTDNFSVDNLDFAVAFVGVFRRVANNARVFAQQAYVHGRIERWGKN